jgi:hypothetical protein
MAAPGTSTSPRARAALLVFVAVAAVGAVLYVVNGRKVWFFGVFGDEWDFLAGRQLNAHDLLERHGDHLVALPAFLFRVLYPVFGLHSYLPYQLWAIGLHIAAAALLRVVMRRAGVGPWLATAAAGAFVLFGAGSQDILIAFQITFSGALVLGLGQLLLADHDGPIDRRDWLALLAGLGALACSQVAIVMIAAVGIAALFRRRWWAAALQTLPLAAIYGLWRWGFGRDARTDSNLGQIARSARTTLFATFDALGQVPFVGWLLAALLVAGAVLAWRDHERRGALGASTALAVAAVLFAALLGFTRFGLGSRFAASSRYLHIVAALVLPLLAVAADAIARRWRYAAPVVLVLLLVGVPGNIVDIERNVGPEARYREYRRTITALARDPRAQAAPRDLHPTPSFAAEVTVGWLLDGVRDGHIPSPPPSTPEQRATDAVRLSLEQVDVGITGCPPLRAIATRRLATGESVRIAGAVTVQAIPGGGPRPQPLPFGTGLLATSSTHELRAVADPLTLRVAPRSLDAALC